SMVAGADDISRDDDLAVALHGNPGCLAEPPHAASVCAVLGERLVQAAVRLVAGDREGEASAIIELDPGRDEPSVRQRYRAVGVSAVRVRAERLRADVSRATAECRIEATVVLQPDESEVIAPAADLSGQHDLAVILKRRPGNRPNERKHRCATDAEARIERA